MDGVYPTEESRWEAVLARDARADGAFWYGVRSTGIYCRPSCPSRRPRRENASFHDSPQEARARGLRACLRCEPDGVSAGTRAVVRVRFLLETAATPPPLSALAADVGLSPFHLQRLFKRAVGLSPKQYAVGLRHLRFKEGLKMGKPVTTAIYDAGHETSSTLYRKDGLGMTPGAYRAGGAGQTIHFTVVESTLGPMLVAATARGLCAVRFGEAEAMTAELRAEYPAATLIEDAAPLEPYLQSLHAYLDGHSPELKLDTDAPGTEFQQRVWAALRQIPSGETRSYAELAGMIGQPRAVRAVATACARNPVALVVPCHRIVPKVGGSGGYRWGVERKAALLEAERGERLL
ncbi:bifunctional DNA-binding transcriptional regulator/O6-methylguanine-DNA methyltransferase Ada [Deinococcus marmoris]|uniref:methylated-DNA--[protein]-cysteine S-methyltransferase n=1 Tax=Deinococcus marmoris TaxID=249408 RepID=A0A1U7NY94_9DEIO|nr:bifunctional DNA-binding transcriptional regulator/O6-methylguanine-DNA methyltransferase Ada [Deinococcus marmoris]OLV17893.1 ADA regulatory protein / Methylated-DNA--protein-cysteine methyltransferase [Deinococcus marmoris]